MTTGDPVCDICGRYLANHMDRTPCDGQVIGKVVYRGRGTPAPYPFEEDDELATLRAQLAAAQGRIAEMEGGLGCLPLDLVVANLQSENERLRFKLKWNRKQVARYRLSRRALATAVAGLTSELAQRDAEIARLKSELQSLKTMPDFLSEALNSGDGTYRP